MQPIFIILANYAVTCETKYMYLTMHGSPIAQATFAILRGFIALLVRIYIYIYIYIITCKYRARSWPNTNKDE